MFTKVAVLGLGKVGHLAAELLVDAGFQVTGIDVRGLPGAPFPAVVSDLANAASRHRRLRPHVCVRRSFRSPALPGYIVLWSGSSYSSVEAVEARQHSLSRSPDDTREKIRLAPIS